MIKVGFIGDMVGRPARVMLKEHLGAIKEGESLDFVIANYENASHGFGLSAKNASELFGYGIDAMTGGNHSFDKKDIIPHLETMPLLRPLNYPETLAGEGVKLFEIQGVRIALLNLMGHYSMPMVDNPFIAVQKVIERLEADYILIDFHAEVTSEKNTLFELLKGKVSAIVGTHTHVGTDDLKISHGTGYVSDIGLSGCFDGVIGMESSVPIKKALTGIGGHFDIPKKCQKILQMIVFELDNGICQNAYKIKAYNSAPYQVVQRAFSY